MLMRPVERGEAPIETDDQPRQYSKYQDARPDLISRLGKYCSYCERRIPTNLAVEHIQNKDDRPDLEREWCNFLLGCVNCNSTKLKKVKDDTTSRIIIGPTSTIFFVLLCTEKGG